MRTMRILTFIWISVILADLFCKGVMVVMMQMPETLFSVLALAVAVSVCFVVAIALLPVVVIGWTIALIVRPTRPRKLPELPLVQLPGLPGWYRMDEKTGYYIKVPPPC